MTSYFLLTLTFALMAILTSQQASAAAISNQDECTKRAYGIYDGLTRYGCNVKEENACSNLFNFAISNLNADLDKCNRSDYVTLCYIKPSGGFFSFTGCSSVSGGGKLTKESCEAEAKKGYIFNGEDGSQTTFEAKYARCVNTIDYNCHDLCN
ncbi:hypothetical protein PS15p_209031 [Mucor circinelloides]